MMRFGLAALIALALASSAPAAPVVGPWSAPANGLQSRVVLDRATFKAGEPIEARVEVKNVSDKAIPVTWAPSASGEPLGIGARNFEVTTPDGRPAVDISVWSQTCSMFDEEEMKKVGPPPQPMLEPGRTLVFAAGFQDYYLGKPGQYTLRWKGTLPALSARDAWQEEIDFMEFDPPKREPAKPTVPALPAAPAVQLEVVPGAPDPIGPLLDVLPPGWRLAAREGRHGERLHPAELVRPSGRTEGRGQVIVLQHFPTPGALGNHTYLFLYIMAEPSELAPRVGETPAEFLGKGKFGCAYLLFLPHKELPKPVDRWNHLRYDVATALGVTEPVPEKPAGADWGRMMCAILKACSDQRLETQDHVFFCGGAVLRGPEGPDQLALLSFDRNAKTVELMRPMSTRDNPDKPYYRVFVRVMPRPPEPGPAGPVAVDRPLDHISGQRAAVYDGKRFGVRLYVAVYTDDDAFRKTLNEILDREVTRALSPAPPPENR